MKNYQALLTAIKLDTSAIEFVMDCAWSLFSLNVSLWLKEVAGRQQSCRRCQAHTPLRLQLSTNQPEQGCTFSLPFEKHSLRTLDSAPLANVSVLFCDLTSHHKYGHAAAACRPNTASKNIFSEIYPVSGQAPEHSACASFGPNDGFPVKFPLSPSFARGGAQLHAVTAGVCNAYPSRHRGGRVCRSPGTTRAAGAPLVAPALCRTVARDVLQAETPDGE